MVNHGSGRPRSVHVNENIENVEDQCPAPVRKTIQKRTDQFVRSLVKLAFTD